MARDPLSSWVPAGGSSRRFRNKYSGRTISRRQYDNLKAQQAGFKNRSQLEGFRAAARKRPFLRKSLGKRPSLDDYMDLYGKAQGSRWQAGIKVHSKGVSMQDNLDIIEVKERREALRAQYPAHAGRPHDLDMLDPDLVADDGPLARILDRSGQRTRDGRPVGAS